jgi:inosose dehydratase
MAGRIANAPVSYGVYGEQAGGAAASPAQLLATMADGGYAGSELGPPGFFGTPQALAAAFAEAGLAAVGAYVPLHLALDDDAMAHDLRRMEVTCQELVAAGGGLAILADEGAPILLENPARSHDARELALDVRAWRLLADRVERAREIVAGYGLDTSFHPHVSTYVESPWEVERLLVLTDVSLTLDVGHILLAGGDPAQCHRAWQDRINHVHIKDVELDVLRRAQRDRRVDFDDWWAGVATPVGQGDLDLDGYLAAALACGYDGWFVIEQDRAPTRAEDYPGVAATQADNRRMLAAALERAGVSFE